MTRPTVISPINTADLPAVAAFMQANLNPKVGPADWIDAVLVPWAVDAPNYGYVLRAGSDVVGAHLAYYSERVVAGGFERFCNLGAWCVLDAHRVQGLRLLTSLLAQDGYHFTDFSPSGNVVALNRRLKFSELDTTAVLVPSRPATTRRRDVRVVTDPMEIEGSLVGVDAEVFADHRRARAVRHVLLRSASESCYVMFRRDTRKGVHAFGSVLHVSNSELFRHSATRLGRHLLVHDHIAAMIVELRVSGGAPRGSLSFSQTRPKMYRSATLADDDIDYLYSELTCLEW